ncbi:MAG: hypothetical protein H6863_06280 [Rhodospirillales bacterium]|nr:hypothetical protein [Rhodospirillales bacterium]
MMYFEITVIVLLVLIVLKLSFHGYYITLISPIYRNTYTKELGCWGYYKIKIPIQPFVGLELHDGKGGIYKITHVHYDKSYNSIDCNTFYDPSCNYKNEEDYEHIKKCAQEWGWKLREVKPGHILVDDNGLFKDKGIEQ